MPTANTIERRCKLCLKRSSDHTRPKLSTLRHRSIWKSTNDGNPGVPLPPNNAGIASMNHSLLTPVVTVNKIMETNFTGTFLFCREAARLMQLHGYGRIVNFTSVAVPLKIEGQDEYAASKDA